jgi:sugar lactone lactonase YvrE
MLRRLPSLLTILILAAIAYLALFPMPLKPVIWSAPKAPGYTGAHAVNQKLAGLTAIAIGKDEGPEHIAIGPDGKLYAAVASGSILRMNADGSAQEVFASTGGRVLGFDFDAAGRFIAADAYRGLLAIGPDKTVTVLADKVTPDDPILYADAVVVAKTGKIYFTDASHRFGAKQWGGTFNASVLDILEHSATGRVLEYDPASKAVRIVMSDLSFANGIALSADESQLFVAETGEYRVWKLPVTASKVNARMAATFELGTAPATGAKPEAVVVLNNLPGYPDNLMRGMNGRIWVGLAKPRSNLIDMMADKPFLREATVRLPKELWPVPKPYGHVIAFDESGKIVADLQDPAGTYPETTGVTETADKLYIQSLHAKVLGFMPKPAELK